MQYIRHPRVHQTRARSGGDHSLPRPHLPRRLWHFLPRTLAVEHGIPQARRAQPQRKDPARSSHHVRQVAAYLAKETAAAAPIVDIFLKINVKAFIVWYGSIDRDSDVTPRIAALLRDLDDAAALVGECGGYRPDIKFVRRVPGNVREATGDLTMPVLHQCLSSKSLLKTFV